VKKVLCKKNAIYPFTSVGRPPKEDTIFGDFIHEITRPMVPVSIPGVHAVHAVDAAGVHPLCLAVASERFVPYARPEDREPMELLKTANALLGFNQVSLSKYLMLAAKEDASGALDARDVPAFFAHVLERIDFARDLHFQTSTTIDTLDYTGTSLNHGSKLVMAAAGPKRRELRNEPADLASLALPAGFSNPKIAMKGVLVVQWDANGNAPAPADIAPLLEAFKNWDFRESYPWVSVVDDTSTIGDSDAHKSLDDFLWLTFTRSDPAQDAYGIDAHFVDKHWAIQAPLVIDARIKPRHQKVLEVSDNVIQKAREVLENA
jgi:4-hydroxy-3-polyprenylbenzoate decarboxylase